MEHWTRGKRCFLEKPEWKTIPWALHPGSKTSFCYIQDILCDMPGLMEDITKLKRLEIEPAQRVSFTQNLVKNISAHLVDLYDWRTKWEEDNPNSCLEVQSPQQPEDEEFLFSKYLQFSALSSAHEIILYNTALLMILGFGFAIIGPTFDARVSNYPLPRTTPHGPLALPGEALIARTVAIEVCQIAEYCLTAHPNSVGVWLISPMKVAQLNFPPTSREAKWLDDRMVAVADISGCEIGRRQGIESR